MEIEACSQVITQLPLSVRRLNSLRQTARLLFIHYCTQIEGNWLSPSQVSEVLVGGAASRDGSATSEVRHYDAALTFVAAEGAGSVAIDE